MFDDRNQILHGRTTIFDRQIALDSALTLEQIYKFMAIYIYIDKKIDWLIDW